MKDVDFLTANGIDVDHSLEILGDMDMYNETLNDFVDESKDRIPKIEEYKNNGDMANYSILVHAMKSDSKYLGFTILADLSYKHELASKENNIEFVNNNYEILINEANRIIDIIEQYLSL